MNQIDSASFHFGKAIKASAAPDISFNARLNRAITGSGANMAKDLKKMLRDSKNAPFKDQIYYSMALVELNRNEQTQAKEYLTQSTFYSGANKRQKAMSYEKLADISYKEKSYVAAQKYYDSCSRFMPEDYPNGDEVKNKAIKLADLVKAVEIAIFEDSVQRIAKMNERDRTDFLKETLKQMEEAEQKRKEAEAAKLLALQSQSNQNTNASGSKFVFNNPKLREEGYNEFKKMWGVRENEDDWRRSDKVVFSSSDKNNLESDSSGKSNSVESSKLTVADLLKDIPLTDSSFAASVTRLLDALYTSGVLYKEVLNENELASQQFEAVLALKKDGLTDLTSAFQLFKIYEGSGNGDKYKQYILNKYPNSDAANYFRDPDFYVKQKQNQQTSGIAYLEQLDAYNKGRYQSVLIETNRVIEEDKSNAFRAEYMLLNVLAAGQLTENKKELLPKLKRIMDEKPGTEQAIRAKEMIAVINGGFSKNETVNFSKTYIYKFDSGVSQYVIVLLNDEEDDVDAAKNTISDFSVKKFKTTRVKVSAKMTTTEKNFILIQEFPTIKIAEEYINAYKAGAEILDDLQDNKIYIITQENLKKLIETAKFDEYKLFYDDNY